jgi:hypothetical protein
MPDDKTGAGIEIGEDVHDSLPTPAPAVPRERVSTCTRCAS